jgi:hypothetical protein
VIENGRKKLLVKKSFFFEIVTSKSLMQ